jgi:hypothetical protein
MRSRRADYGTPIGLTSSGCRPRSARRSRSCGPPEAFDNPRGQLEGKSAGSCAQNCNAERVRHYKECDQKDVQEKKNDMTKKTDSKKDESPAQLIDARIEELDDWRGEMLSRLRALIKQAEPDVVEEWK